MATKELRDYELGDIGGGALCEQWQVQWRELLRQMGQSGVQKYDGKIVVEVHLKGPKTLWTVKIAPPAIGGEHTEEDLEQMPLPGTEPQPKPPRAATKPEPEEDHTVEVVEPSRRVGGQKKRLALAARSEAIDAQVEE